MKTNYKKQLKGSIFIIEKQRIKSRSKLKPEKNKRAGFTQSGLSEGEMNPPRIVAKLFSLPS